MPIQVSFLVQGITQAIDTETVECEHTATASGSWSATLDFGSYSIPASGSLYQIAVSPVASVDVAESYNYGSATASSQVYIDTTAPSITGVNPASGSILASAGNLISVICSEDGVVSYSISNDGGSGFLGCNGGAAQITLADADFPVGGGLIALTINLSDNAGNSASSVTRYYYRGNLTVERLYGGDSGFWNDHVNADPTTTACSGSETTATGCLRAAAYRKVATSFSSCMNLTMADSLGVFEWSCSGSPATFTGTFKPTKGLSDVIDWASSSFKTMSVTVSHDSSGTLFASSATLWWSDTFESLTTASSTLENSNRIYLVTSDLSVNGLSIIAEKVSIVVKPTVTLSWNLAATTGNCLVSTVSTKCLITATGRNFLWFEGAFSGGSPTTGGAYRLVDLSGSNDTRFHEVRFQMTTPNPSIVGNLGHCVSIRDGRRIKFTGSSIIGGCRGGAGLSLEGISVSNFNQVGSARNATYGLFVREGSTGYSSSDNIFSYLTTASNDLYGVKLFDTGVNNSFEQMASYSNGQAGFYAMGTSQIHITRSFVSGNGSGLSNHGGIIITNGSGHSVVATTSAMNDGPGLQINENSAAPFDTGYLREGAPALGIVLNYVGYLNDGSGLRFGASGTASISTSVSRMVLAHIIGTRNTSPYIDASGLFGGGVNASSVLATGGFFGTETASVSGISGVPLTSTLASSWAGGPLSSDSNNPSVSSVGKPFGELILPAAWLNRESVARAWQKHWSSNSTPILADAGACLSGSCGLVDWSLSSSDSVIRARIENGPGGAENTSFQPGGLCPAFINGNTTAKTSLSATCSDSSFITSPTCSSALKRWYEAQSFMHNAVEVITATGGDDDGLCESGETCLYTPNFGAYQGHGTLGTCSFTDGSNFTGITMHVLPTNGR